MRKRIEADDRNTLTEIMLDEGRSYQKIATALGISRQAVRQIMQKPLGCMRVSSLLKVAGTVGYHLELVKEE